MFHLIKYRLKCSLGNRQSMFWALCFPLILGAMFYVTFGSFDGEDMETIPVAVVAEEKTESADIFVQFLEGMETDDSQIISLTKMIDKEAEQKLIDREVTGIFYAKDIPELTIGANGMEESILQSLLESYVDNRYMLENIAKNRPEGMQTAVSALEDYKEMVRSVSLKGRTMNGMIQYFFALIAMACMYGGFLGIATGLELQANLTDLVARRCITPTNRMQLILADMTGTFFIHFFNIIVLLLYLKYILRVDFGNQMGSMVLVSGIGSMFGVAMGIFVGSIGKLKEGIKIGILLAISMVGSFLAGLMNGNMKDIVERYCPIINRINPAALISDAFYCLNVYDDPARYTRDLISLIVWTAAMLAGAFWIVRRERYDSI